VSDANAPYRAPTPAAAPPRDWMGWALVVSPALGAIVQILLPWTLFGTFAGFAGILSSIVLLGIDAKRWKQDASGHVVRAFLLWAIFFPLYVRRRALWGPPNRQPFAVLAVVLIIAGTFFRPFAIKDRASVRCVYAGKTLSAGLDCTIEKTEGPMPVEVCWDLAITCANGPGGNGHACGTVSPGVATHVAMPYASLVGAQGCDRVTGTELANVVVRE
jgi:hypothetical protein